MTGAEDYRWWVNGEELTPDPADTLPVETTAGESETIKTVTLGVTVEGQYYSGSHLIEVVASGSGEG